MSNSYDAEPEGCWPDVLRLCFGPGDDRRLDANISYIQGRQDFYPYAEGYRRAAQALLESMPRRQQNPDFLVWPLVFLWRHYLELTLKDIIAKGRMLDEGDQTFPEHHGLAELWRDARSHIARIGSNDAPELANVEAVIDEFQRIDPRATGFRYPVAKGGGGPSLPCAPSIVNLGVLQSAMEALANFFDAVRMAMQAHSDSMHELYR